MKTLMILLLLAVPALAGVPQVFNYQGYVSDLDGSPLEGTYNLVFRIYDVASGADPALWTETHSLVQVTDGVFSVLLGSLVVLPTTVLEEDALWIGVTVGTDTEIAPRLQVTSTPWAYRAAIADSSVVTGAGGGDGGTVFNVATGTGLTGGPITTSGTISVANGGIGTSHLASNAVTGAKIADNTIGVNDIATAGVGSAEIADGSIMAVDIATSAIGASQIASNAVGAAEIAANAVGSSEIATSAVGSDEIASGAVGTSEIANNSVYDYDIADEPGVAAIVNTASPILTSTPITVTSRSINHPTSGYIVAIASCYGYLSHVSGLISEIVISISTTDATENSSNDVVFTIPSSEPSGVRRTPMSTTEVFYVTGDNTSTFYLVADADHGNSNYVFSSNLVLMFFPTAYGSVSKGENLAVDPGR